jgi:hypothetical protein
MFKSLPNPNIGSVLVYENEFVTNEVLNRSFSRLLNNDVFLYHLVLTEVARNIEISQGLGTTKNFIDPIYVNYLPESHQYVLDPADFGKFIIMDGRQSKAGDKNPVVVLPSFSLLNDADVGKAFTISTRYGRTNEEASVFKVLTNLTDDVDEQISFLSNIEYPLGGGGISELAFNPFGFKFNSSEGIEDKVNNFGSFCRVILGKAKPYSKDLEHEKDLESKFYWIFEGNSKNWMPLFQYDILNNDFKYTEFSLIETTDEMDSWKPYPSLGSTVYYLDPDYHNIISDRIEPFEFKKPSYVVEAGEKMKYIPNVNELSIGEWSWFKDPIDNIETIFVKLKDASNPNDKENDFYLEGVLIETQ